MVSVGRNVSIKLCEQNSLPDYFYKLAQIAMKTFKINANFLDDKLRPTNTLFRKIVII
jgi:hypothetical protein